MTVFLSTSIQFNLPPGLLASVCYVETRHNVQAVHYNDGQGNSVGICQIKLKTAQWLGFRGTEQELLDPATNIYYAGAYLNHQRNRYGNVQQAVIAYNQGHSGGLTTTEYQLKVFKVWRNNN